MKLDQYTITTVFCPKRVGEGDGMYIIPPDVLLLTLEDKTFLVTSQGCQRYNIWNWNFSLKNNHTIITSSSQVTEKI